MKKVFKYFGIFIGALIALSIVLALFDSEEEITEPEKIETSAPVEEKEEVFEITAAQQNTIEAFESGDFVRFAEEFYGLTAGERSDVYSSSVEGKTVTWSGIITDLDTVSDSIILIGKEDAYNGADWDSLNADHKDLLPYVIVIEMNNPSVKDTLTVGEQITIKGEIGSRGDLDMNFNWKLYKGEIAN